MERTKYVLFKIVIFVNKTLIIFHFLCQSSTHYVIKSLTKNDPNFQEMSKNLSLTLSVKVSLASKERWQIE